MDFKGGAGKSLFVKKYLYENKAILLSWDPSRDVLHARAENMDKKIVFFDFTRSKPGRVDISECMSAVESIKNGAFLSPKYASKQMVGSIPHIVIFANWIPPSRTGTGVLIF